MPTRTLELDRRAQPGEATADDHDLELLHAGNLP
jgi:hypothetical protein